MSVRVFAPAKINLTLEVGPPRVDGLHPIQSAVMFADVGDWVCAEANERLSLRIDGEFADRLACDESNLVLRAARALANAAALSAPGAALTLTKTLPIASGIGGGSADAAAALRALNQLWGLHYDDARLAAIARPLGADVPACVAARPVYMTGTGADIAPMQAPLLHAVLVNPLQALATADVYRKFDAMQLGGRFAPRPAPHWRDAACVYAGARAIGNDLEAPACALMPELAGMLQRLRNDSRVRHAALSGSGATIFALVDDATVAAALARDLAVTFAQYWVRATVLDPAHARL
jgi:4-diphosphocytidyl-2-C-methyl-D-erythritol kinase